MKDHQQATFPEILQVVAGEHIVGLRIASANQHKNDHFEILPQFETRIWYQEIHGEKLTPVPATLIDAVTNNETTQAVFIDTLLASPGVV
jgi:hypothetical protein